MGTSCFRFIVREAENLCNRTCRADACVRPALALRRRHSGPDCYCAIIDCNDIIAIMASITIRNLEEATKRKLKVRAALRGHSMEQEAREILKSALQEKAQEPKTGADLVAAIRQHFAPLGGVELEPLPREPIRDPDWLKDWK